MSFDILNRWSSAIVFHSETAEDIAAAVLDAKKCDANLRDADLYGANLRSADLYGADLRSADLRDANLYGANLSDANLSGANLYGANLSDANLRDANLSEADLSGANLSEADLSDANLREADLSEADLSGANLYGANLRDANLRGAKGINKYLTTPLYLLLDQPGLIRAYKLVNEENEGPFKGGIRYEIGAIAECHADTDETEICSHGINLATLDWCMKEWRPGHKILVVEHTAADIACIPIGSDGKYRVHRCTVISEKDLSRIGLTKAQQEESIPA